MMIYGAIGLGAFVYGKNMAKFGPIIIGILLMAYPYFVSGTMAMWLIGAVLCAALYFIREK